MINKTFKKELLYKNLKSLELSRLFLGQGWYLVEFINNYSKNYSWEDKQNFNNKFKNILFKDLPGNSYLSICSNKVNKKAKVNIDMFDVIKYTLSWDEAKKDPEKDKRDWSTMLGVNYDFPFHIYREIELLKINKKSFEYWDLIFSNKYQYDVYCESVSLGKDIKEKSFNKLPAFLEIKDSKISSEVISLCNNTFKN